MPANSPTLRRWASNIAGTAAATTATVKAVDGATSYIYVTLIKLSIITHTNAKRTIFQDSTPTVFAAYEDLTTTASSAQGTITWDFGKRGIKLAIGKDFQVLGEAAGSPCHVYAEGYQGS
jgi:hypothetical protein